MKIKILSLFLAAPLFSQESIPVKDVLFFPPEFYVGDAVEMRVRVEHPSPEALMAGSDYPRQDWIEIRRVDVVRSEGEVWIHVTFVSFSPGARTFPVIRLGAGSLRNLTVNTGSVLGDDLTLAPYRDPLPLQGSENLLALLVFLLLGLPIFLHFLVSFGSRAWARARKRWASARPYKVFFSEMKNLRKRCLQLSTPEFYSGLGLCLRKWLAKVHDDARLLSLTADEWGDTLMGLGTLEPLVWKDLLRRCELWVYSGGENLEEARLNDLDRAERTALVEQRRTNESAGV